MKAEGIDLGRVFQIDMGSYCTKLPVLVHDLPKEEISYTSEFFSRQLLDSESRVPPTVGKKQAVWFL